MKTQTKPTQLQITFLELETKQARLRSLKTTLKDILEDYPGYTEAREKASEWSKKAKLIKHQAEEENDALMTKIDAAKADVKGHKEKLSDLAINELTAGNTVTVIGSDEVPQLPEWKVKFRKISNV